MKTRIYESEYRKAKSIIMENSYLKIMIIKHGGRIISIFNKEKNWIFGRCQ